MKPLFIIIVLFRLCFGSEETYSFVQKYVPGKEYKYKEESMWSFEVTGSVTESGSSSTSRTKCLGYSEEGFLLLEETMIDLIATKKTFDKMSADHEANALIGIPYTLFIDTLSGSIDHVKTEFREFEEQINSTVMGMGNSIDNKIYPFGMSAFDIKAGDRWSTPLDSVSFFMGDDGNENFMIFESQYILNKIKIKGKKKLAFVSGIHNISCHMEFMQDSKFFEGEISGKMKSKERFDLIENMVVHEKVSGALRWNFTLEDKNINATWEVSSKEKRIN